ncbi:hypothetical protein GCM10022222_04440 [Amycolatopsis ultiminotia]|uniref:OmpA-like domain-containing protein n=1 Tax=Amycolatopsis ultiminotia TaxID=543629 RepID=A0ABP6UZE5_9PSEU
MHKTLVQAVTGAALVAALVTACGSGGSDSSDSSGSSGQNTAAPSSSGAGASGDNAQGGADDQAVQQANTAIQQATQQAPITFTTEKTELTAESKQTLAAIAKALQGNAVKLKVETHAGYSDAQQSKELSEKRAQAISSELEQAGLGKDRIQTEATGNEKAQGAQALETQFSATS